MIARWRPSWMDVNTWSISPPTCETIALTAATLPSTSVVSTLTEPEGARASSL